VAVQRWQAFTGKQATLQSDLRTFDAVAAERVPAAPGVKSSATNRATQQTAKPRSTDSTKRTARNAQHKTARRT